MFKIGLYRKIIRQLEVLYLPFPSDNKGQCRSFHPAYRKCRLMTGPLGSQCERPGKIHPDQPIRSCPGQCGLLQVIEIVIVAQISERLLDAFFIKRIEQYPLDRLLVPDILQYFVDQQLPFPVRITGMDDFGRFFDQPLDHSELFLAGSRHQQFPVARNNRQVFHPPFFIFRIIFTRFRLAEDVAETPGNYTGACRNIAISAADRAWQILRDLRPQAGFFRNIQFHASLTPYPFKK